MRQKFRLLSLMAMVFVVMVSGVMAVGTAKITVNVDKDGVEISPSLFGIFFEEINRAGDGGLYGEMLENRSFEDDSSNASAWQSIGKGEMFLDKENPVNSRNLTSLRLDIYGDGGGVANSGFSGVGLSIEKGKKYDLSVYVRAGEGFDGPISVKLEGRSGDVLAESKIRNAGTEWKKHELSLRSNGSDLAARLVLEASGKGSVWFDMVSLFPNETWKGHGMRMDLAKMIEDMGPSFVRFPGGCFVEGHSLKDAVRWKETIGDPAQRKGNYCIWGYQTTGGFGAHEFLQWCEDLGSDAMYVINCGMSHTDHVPMDKMDEVVQDAMDFIEYAKGPATSEWGAKRAAAGHPEPFNLTYLQIGNENGGPLYNERYNLFHDAIKAKYPEIKLIACDWGGVPKDRPLDIIDEHYYNNPKFFMQKAYMYDDYDRSGPKVYVGEYAVTQGCGGGNLVAALGEAAYMTGLEKNSDHVVMASYAPLFVNPSMRRWNPNAIVFDQGRSYGTPSYHVQKMFANNVGDVVCPIEIETPIIEVASPRGGISLATWATQVDFKDVKVTRGDKVLYESDFANGNSGFRFHGGDWKSVDGALRQNGSGKADIASVGSQSWGSEYTVTLKARKISGDEGFVVGFQLNNDRDKHWINFGGWGNKSHGLEGIGSNRRIDGSIETGRWYDVRIELSKGNVDCFLDGKKILSDKEEPTDSIFAVASRTDDGEELILKVVNVSEKAIRTKVEVNGVDDIKSSAKGWVLTSGSMNDENTFERPENIVPKEIKIKNASTEFVRNFPARSVTVLRMQMKN